MRWHVVWCSAVLLICVSAQTNPNDDSGSETCVNRLELQQSQFQASSFADEASKPEHATLHGQEAWRAKPTSQSGEYLHIDLGRTMEVRRVLTQGDPRNDLWVKTFDIKFSADWKDWGRVNSSDDSGTFDGNNDRTSVNIHEVKFTARHIRIYPLTWNTGIALRVGLYGCSNLSCSRDPIGVAYKSVIPNEMVWAPSAGKKHHAHHGRLNSKRGAWCAVDGEDDVFLQIDLGQPHLLCAIAIQGNPVADLWVQSFLLRTSIDKTTWSWYREAINWRGTENTDNLKSNGKELFGSFDRNTVVTNTLVTVTVARYVQIFPKTFHGARCMRAELYGATMAACGMSPVGVEDMGLLPDHRITASSFYDSRFLPKNGRLNSKTAWATKRVDQDDYLQIDLGNPVVLCGVATQGGGPDYNEFVKRYLLETSMNGYKWVAYKTQDDRQAHLFPANQDKHRTSYNGLPVPIIAKFIRIFPKDHYVHKTMKVELYGVAAAGREAVGIEVTHKALPSISDNQLTAFSNLNNQTRASAGRLYGPSAWCAKEQERSQWFQADLLKVRAVIGIATQSAASPRTRAVETYRLKMGVTQDKWTYTEHLLGAWDDVTSVNWLSSAESARFVRFSAFTWSRMICMRVEVYAHDNIAPFKINMATIKGTLIAAPSSSATIRCVTNGDKHTRIVWKYAGGRDVTHLSSGQLYKAGEVISRMQVNFTSVDDFRRKYPCSHVTDHRVKCTLLYGCRADYGILAGLPVEKELHIELDIREPTTQPTETEVEPTTRPTAIEPTTPNTAEQRDDTSSSTAPRAWALLVLLLTLLIVVL
ncbi:uncharacterized protein LOC5504614 [Nematostella vectensis]|uniref:uncharacterized protein LOC5504614 n=1 Tax=Nematostella vectensis TaxID=45351 RepID=UPI002076FE87|nr:uncharacterized protein LOC5504614 [Nematostella vectensis]